MPADSYGSHYQVLGIGRKASREDVDLAYFELARKHHPDVAGDSPETVAKFARINEAYLVLSDPAEREKYDEEIAETIPWEPEPVVASEPVPREEAVKSEEEAPVEQAPAVERKRRVEAVETPRPGGVMDPRTLARIKTTAGKMIREGDFWKSGDLLNKAAMAFPKDPEVRRLQARAADGRGRLREAAEYLKAACEAEYFNPENHFLLGKVYTRAEQFALARKSFENALSWQEDHEGATRALEDLDRLEGKGSPIWKKLFRGRKK